MTGEIGTFEYRHMTPVVSFLPLSSSSSSPFKPFSRVESSRVEYVVVHTMDSSESFVLVSVKTGFFFFFFVIIIIFVSVSVSVVGIDTCLLCIPMPITIAILIQTFHT
ncbi:hypothetical protein L249_8092 [Ophiocordyceps polyrhachis-furcata BCC 54312]|uniref:Transmembrane protein n=1 Tax=Ophiocordyceps polyrhachis-furcata BCC 54312 TaxID=1330021 RepID=A0A367LHZ2_9HYPO|nr:hypothetical protein L249_8092 [Ophiocordyceps polyrhachis-furcata BCC 54312]